MFFGALVGQGQKVLASSSIDKPIKTMAFINGNLMASPVTPVLFDAKKGQSQFSLRPASFSADSGLQTFDGARWRAEFSGYGLAALYIYQLSSSFGVYLVGMANQIVDGEFLGRGSNPSNPVEDVISQNVRSDFLQAGFGFSYSVINSKWFVVQLMAGPGYTSTNASQQVLQQDPSDPDDFDMTMSVSDFSYIAGAQIGLKIFENLAINPYFMVSDNLGEKCVEYDMVIRQSGDQTGITDPVCGDVGGGTPKMEYDLSFQTFGVNLLTPNWGIGVNVFSEVGEIQGIEGTEVEMYYLTLSFKMD